MALQWQQRCLTANCMQHIVAKVTQVVDKGSVAVNAEVESGIADLA